MLKIIRQEVCQTSEKSEWFIVGICRLCWIGTNERINWWLMLVEHWFMIWFYLLLLSIGASLTCHRSFHVWFMMNICLSDRRLWPACSRDEVLGEKSFVDKLSFCHHFGGVQQACGGCSSLLSIGTLFDKKDSRIELELSWLSHVFDDKKMISSDKQR